MDAKYNYIIDSMKWRIVLNLARLGLRTVPGVGPITALTHRNLPVPS
jgi:hypothetical protein